MYRFYFNVDTGEFLQMYYKKEEVTENFFHEKLEKIAGVWSDCYMPISLATKLFERLVILPQDISDDQMFGFRFDNQVFDHDFIYPASENDLLGDFYWATKPQKSLAF